MSQFEEGTLLLTDLERDMLEGGQGPGVAMAMRVVVALARVRGATELVQIGGAHIDSCLYHGRAGLDFATRLVELDATVQVPTTLNVGSLDLLHPATVLRRTAHEQEVAAGGRALMDAYVALGARPTWTCAPYQVDSRPALGEHVAWAESNAIVFANSVLGARTDRYGDFLDICAAITARAPHAGLHLTQERRGGLVLDCRGLGDRTLGLDLTYPLLGYLAGLRCGTSLNPVLLGLPSDIDEDRLKALGAAAASSGGVAMFHVVGVTPEAPTLEAALQGGPAETVVVTAQDLRAARAELSTAVTRGDEPGRQPGEPSEPSQSGEPHQHSEPGEPGEPRGGSAGTGVRLDAVSLGTPHASLAEIAALADGLRGGPPLDPRVSFYLSTGRSVLEQARTAGHVEVLEQAGVQIVVDTCTYVTSILDPATRVVMTTSGKWAHYAPANLGVDVVLASLEECLASARAGEVVLDGDLLADVGTQHPDSGTPPPPPSSALHPDPGTPTPQPGSALHPGSGTPTPPPSNTPTPPPGRTLHPGSGTGAVLALDLPLSFWGGVAEDGTIVDRHHPQVGHNLTGRVLAMTTGRGSSSSSSVLAELLRSGTGPAAIVLTEADAIVTLGAIVAAELYGTEVPVVAVSPEALATLHDGDLLTVVADAAGARLLPSSPADPVP